jgi:uncharacterized protein YidB (DUF937 family)
MSLFDQIGRALGGAVGGSGGDSSSALVGHLLETLGKGGQQDGLAGLVQSFQTNGLGKIAESWVGTGENLPVSQTQITQVLGQGVIQRVAQATGMSPETLSAKLTEVLPMVVDKLTPDGKMPDSGMLAQVLNLLKNKS